jgi:hypothetical protein
MKGVHDSFALIIEEQKQDPWEAKNQDKTV